MNRDGLPGLYVLDADGRPLPIDDVLVWGQWLEEPGHRVVASDHVGGAHVSTVFLGIDHNFGDEGDAPILWETMIFGGELDQECWRYASREEALAGHAVAVQAALERAEEVRRRGK